jgi:MOSC domain-containing protein YiiM
MGTAQIYSIVIQPEGLEYGERIERYLRFPIQAGYLIADHGLQGDQKAGHNPNRQLNLLSYEWLEELKPKGYRTGPGDFGEQIIVRDFPLEGLQPGDRLQLGAEACIEITKPRTGCSRLEAAQGQSLEGIGGPIGQLARVVNGGEIRVGDLVRLLKRDFAGEAEAVQHEFNE